MATSSNPLPLPSPPYASEQIQDHNYLYASIANVSNFVSVKLSSERNYHIWKTQMLCLMKSHNMVGLVDDSIVGPRASTNEIMDQYDTLLKGWIFGSVSQNVLGAVVDLISAKDVWDKLKSFYDTTQQDKTPTKLEEKMKTEDIDHRVATESKPNVKDTITIDVETNDSDKETKTEGLSKEELEELNKAVVKGYWHRAEPILKKNKDAVRVAIKNDGSTIIHLAVGIGDTYFVKRLLSYVSDEDVLEKRSSDGSTPLHIAAIVGNRYAARLLLEKNKELLRIKDNKGDEALHKAYEHMHLDTIGYLFKAMDDGGKTKSASFHLGDTAHPDPGVEVGVDLLVNAIFAKEYNLASELIENFPKFAVINDGVLMAMAKTFPSGLDYGETLIYPSLSNLWQTTRYAAVMVGSAVLAIPMMIYESIWGDPSEDFILEVLIIVTLAIPTFFYYSIYLLLLMVCFLFLLPYFALWKAASKLVAPIKHIEKKKKECEEGEKVLRLVCDEIDKLGYSGTHHPYYTRPILEAACQNTYKVVHEILSRSPEAIQCTNKSGYDIIQLAVIHRSVEIYNLIYDIGERKNLYRTIVDSSKNNILHLAGKLAPSYELNRRTGAALQLQRELQWQEEVKKLVFPTYITQENIFKETPDMVFTREHENLLKEGEKWMKTTAESCSITAALITTIVFAAAITVPGGTHQETGTPLFRSDIAFTIFAISDAISLFTSSTALLVFLSILTARFSEKDFLVSLPRRLVIGLCALLLSTTAMMVAFSATLFLVFCDRKPWMLAPICALALIPISSFVTLQFPLIVDLFWSTHVRIFGMKKKSGFKRFDPDNNFKIEFW
ncbi:uncharacterized protein LOC111881632 [Lactuca sativa]|uniref:PGG domain-containing protein n=1 Tax=Lactuca sativa TaxID=4236 RepID=A0A9R1V1K1_LACSA|nr:uncharacterized protein LOC111881632 [Lactuca sativa]KAJ0197578.1 hypothetical protein LSAT_V11C700361860 [Lactuca sativa]